MSAKANAKPETQTEAEAEDYGDEQRDLSPLIESSYAMRDSIIEQEKQSPDSFTQ